MMTSALSLELIKKISTKKLLLNKLCTNVPTGKTNATHYPKQSYSENQVHKFHDIIYFKAESELEEAALKPANATLFFLSSEAMSKSLNLRLQ